MPAGNSVAFRMSTGGMGPRGIRLLGIGLAIRQGKTFVNRSVGMSSCVTCIGWAKLQVRSVAKRQGAVTASNTVYIPATVLGQCSTHGDGQHEFRMDLSSMHAERCIRALFVEVESAHFD